MGTVKAGSGILNVRGSYNTMTKLCLIVAISENNKIGLCGKLPWDFPEDLAHFKRLTHGYPCIGGRNTFLHDIGRPLPGRRSIVVTRNPVEQAGFEVAGSLHEAIAIAKQGNPYRTFIIGGAQLYQEALPLVQELFITRIKAAVEGDRELNLNLSTQWQYISCQKVITASTRNPGMHAEFQYWQRR